MLYRSQKPQSPHSPPQHSKHDLPTCLMVYMPDSVVSTKEDYPQHIEYQLPEQFKQKTWHHVGVVSEHTHGLLLLTDNHEFAHKLGLINLPQKFYALITGQVTPENVQQFQKGIKIDGTVISADMKIIQANQQESKVEVQISKGGSPEVTHMFAQISTPVKELIRIAQGPIQLESTLMPSETRELRTEETQQLYELIH